MNTTLFLQSLTKKDHTVVKSDPSFVLVSSDSDKHTHKIIERISKIDLVSQVVQVEGMYDLVVKIDSNSIDKIKDVIANKIRHIDGVRTCLSLFGVYPYHLKKIEREEVKVIIGKKEISASSRV